MKLFIYLFYLFYTLFFSMIISFCVIIRDLLLFFFPFRYWLKRGHLPYEIPFSAVPYSPELEYPMDVFDALVLSLKENAHKCDLQSLEQVCFQITHLLQ